MADVIKYQEGKLNAYLYSRYENPTVVAVEQKLAAVDGAEASLLFSSGMAAISTALMSLLKSGDEVVCSAAIYGGTFHIIEDLLSKFGVARRFVSLDDLADLGRVIGPKTKLVWFESPINPTLRCVDVRAVAAGVQEGRGAIGDRQHVRRTAQPARALDGHRSVDAERHQVPQRAQRRHRRRAVGLDAR